VVATRSGDGGGKGVSAGGSGRREAAGGVLERERGLDIHLQRLLVVLHHEYGIPTRADDFFGQIPLTKHGIADDHLPGHG
jgi:hypothetical protein